MNAAADHFLLALPDVGLYSDSTDGGIVNEEYYRPACADAGFPRRPPRLTPVCRRHDVPADAILGPIVHRAGLRYDVVREALRRRCPVDVDASCLRRALEALSNPRLFETELLLPRHEWPAVTRRPVSVVPAGVMTQMRNIVSDCALVPGLPEPPMARLYLVPKRGLDADLWRVIFAALALNARCRRPPRAPVPDLRVLITMLMSATAVFTADLRSWYFQFSVSRAVAALFFVWQVRTAAGGAVLRMKFDRLPMGWCWSVFIACSCALVLFLAGSFDAVGAESASVDWVAVWIDDCVVWDTDVARLRQRWSAIETLLAKAGVVVKTQSGPVSTFELVGLEFDLRCKRWRLRTTWVAACRRAVDVVRSRVAAGACTLRRFWEAVGSAVWASYALILPYAVLEPCFEVLRRALPGGRTPTEATLAAMLEVTTDAMSALVRVAACAHEWRSLPRPPSCVLPLATDASALGRGAVFTCVTTGAVWSGVRPLTFRDQQRLELAAMADAVDDLVSDRVPTVRPPPRGARLLMLVDNLGLAWRLARWQTAGPASPRMVDLWNVLARSGWTLHCGWIRTAVMPADAPSRWERSGWSAVPTAFGPLIAQAFFPADVAPSSLII